MVTRFGYAQQAGTLRLMHARTESLSSGADDFAFGSARYAWIVVAILSGLQIVSNVDRQILSLAVEPLKRDFAISDIDVSLLQGIAFALFYSIVAVPIGLLADRWRRDRILIISMMIWVVATVGCMMAQSFSALFLARLLVGLGDAALVPVTFSILSDYFPRAKLAGAIGTITGAGFLGTGASLTFGGLMMAKLPVDQAVTLPMTGSVFGWQLAFGFASVLGLLLVMALFAVREPPRRAAEDSSEERQDKPSVADVVRYLFAHKGYLISLLGGIILLASFQYGLTTWAVALFIRKFAWTATQIGFIYGLYFMIIGTVASLAGGKLCDYLRSRGRRDANFLIPFGSILILLPSALVFALNDSGPLSVTMLGVITFFVVLSFGPAMAAIPAYVPSTMRAQLTAFTMLLATLLGAGGGPWLVAFFTDIVFGNPLALPYSLAICAPLLLIPAGICFFIGGRTARHIA